MPLTDMQQAYLANCNHRWNIKTGATGSGKTFLDCLAVIPKRVLACKGEGLIVLLGNTRGTLERNVLEPMREIWPGLVGQISGDNTLPLFGHKAYALGADSKKHIARLQGTTIEYGYGDEITTWAQGVFEMLKSRLRCAHSHFDGTCNPDNPNHWFKTFLDSDADIYQQAYTIDDNPTLTPDFVENIKQEYAGTVYYYRYILGRWVAAEGLVYPAFSNCLVDATPYKPTQYAVSLDYGTLNATAMILWGLCGTTWYAIREAYHSGRDERHQLTDDEYMDMLLTLMHDVSVSRIIIDPSAASFITLVKKRGWHVDKADNDVLDGIRDTATAMQRGIVKVVKSSCPHLCQEMGGYLWDEKAGTDRPLKINDHMPDACRYFVRTMKLVRRS